MYARYFEVVLIINYLINTFYSEVNSYAINSINERNKRALFGTIFSKWPNGIIPYITTFENDKLDMIKTAMSEWNKETCITFENKTEKSNNLINITDGERCESEFYGMGNKQEQYVTFRDPQCFDYGVLIHELGHVIGLLHEHQRFDRDKYIKIEIKDVADPYLSQFDKIPENISDTVGTPYDLQSIMHYGPNTFGNSKNTQTIFVNNVNYSKALMNTYDKDLSFWDVKAVNDYYKCSSHCKESEPCKGISYRDKYCQCITLETFMQRRCVNKLKDEECDQKSAKNQCHLDPSWMSFNCRKSCNICFQVDLQKAGLKQLIK